MKKVTLEGLGASITVNEEADPQKLEDEGWVYWDPPTKFSHEMWEFLLSVLGEGNYVILVQSEGKNWARGQFMINPTGVRNLANCRDDLKKKRN